ncbi:MAG: UvrD-helicase domain-containing protein [Candidatus Helarchaeota archaeon]
MNRLIIAAAGSGKTSYLVEEALKIRNNILMTTYTINNKEEIKKRILQRKKYIPENMTIQTWFSMLLQHGVKPYQGYLFEKKIKGMVLVNNYSTKFVKESNIEKYYFNDSYKIYSDKLSKFVVKCDEKSRGAVIDRLSRIYSYIFIDEVQDLAGHDLEILKLLFQSKSNILLVGDPRQVVYLTHPERKNKKYKDGKIKEFIQNECKEFDVEIDDETLNFSYRNTQHICNFSSKLFPEYKVPKSKQLKSTNHDGIFFVRNKDIDEYLRVFQPIQLRFDKKTKVNKKFIAMNFGDSKGLEFDRVLIYPTEDFIKWIFNNASLRPQTRSKFYVAITRAKYSVGIVYDYDKNTNVNENEIKKWKP